MKDFIAIDFETANPQRVSACALGFAKVRNSQVVESHVHLIKPIGGHAPFQSKIHGIKEEHTFDKPHFGELFPQVKGIFSDHLVAHSQFDKQVLKALSSHFNLGLAIQYTDSSALAKDKLPTLKNHKLKTLAKHFGLSAFKHHDAKEDAIACANIFLRLIADLAEAVLADATDEKSEFYGMLKGILADEEVNYKEAYELLYWLEDHPGIRSGHEELFSKLKMTLEDKELNELEASELQSAFSETLELGCPRT